MIEASKYFIQENKTHFPFVFVLKVDQQLQGSRFMLAIFDVNLNPPHMESFACINKSILCHKMVN